MNTASDSASLSLTSIPTSCPLVLEASQATKQPEFVARWVPSWQELEELQESWAWLEQNACWKNPSLESNYLIPALKHLASENIRVLVVENKQARSSDPHRLAGVIPFVSKGFKLPFKCLEIWKHDQCFDATPLLARENTEQIWSTICQFLKAEGIGLLNLDTVSAESCFASVIENTARALDQSIFHRNQFTRAAFQPSESADQYMAEFVSKNTRKKFRRMNRQLEELAEVTYETSTPSSDFDFLTREFMRIEASGWKGRNNTALNSNQSTFRFYEELIERSSRAEKARFLSLNLGGKPIAMLSDLQSGSTVYSYKTAFDESFAKYSPGLLAELKNLEFLHRDKIVLADSCTEPDNSTINRIWGQQLRFQSVVIGLKTGLPKLAVQAFPWMQRVVRTLKRK